MPQTPSKGQANENSEGKLYALEDHSQVLHRKILRYYYLSVLHLFKHSFCSFTDSRSNSEENLLSSVSIIALLINKHRDERKKRERVKESESLSFYSSLYPQTEDNEKEINRLSTFPFPPCMNSINRRFNTEWVYEPHITLLRHIFSLL